MSKKEEKKSNTYLDPKLFRDTPELSDNDKNY